MACNSAGLLTIDRCPYLTFLVGFEGTIRTIERTESEVALLDRMVCVGPIFGWDGVSARRTIDDVMLN